MKRNYYMVVLVMLIFVVISFVTNILDPLEPNIQDSFHLSQMAAGFMAFSFYIAYGVMSIPAGMLVERFKAKAVIISAFGIAFIGVFTFALNPSYVVALPSLFAIGVGFAMLQVVINPLLRVAGGEEHFAFFGNLSQLVFGGASFVSPHVYVYLVHHLKNPSLSSNALIAVLAKLVPSDMPWVSLYWVFVAVIAAMILLISMVKIPPTDLQEDEKIGSIATLKMLIKKRTVILFFIGIFLYVGTEQGIAVWISKFLETYHHVDPAGGGHGAVAGFWGLMMVGCALGLLLLKLFDCRKLLITFGIGASITLIIGVFGPCSAALIALPLMGFWCSIMWPTISSLALNSLDKHHGSFAGILCTGIAGGGFLPPIIGKIGDSFGLRWGLLILLINLAYIISIGFWARPLVNNATTLRKPEKMA